MIPAAREYAVARRRMVREQIAAAGVTDRRVLQAMEEVPRHLFVPRLLAARAQQASALPIGFGQTISKPFTVGLMTALLELQGHEHVLEVGTGSGYQAAVLARLARSVISVERVIPLAERSRQDPARTGFRQRHSRGPRRHHRLPGSRALRRHHRHGLRATSAASAAFASSRIRAIF